MDFFGGALWAVVLSSIVWPIWTHLPVRLPLARCFEALDAYRAALDGASWAAGDPRWNTLARTHARATRAAIEAAREVALESRARRSGESAVGSNLRTLLALADRLLPLLAAATEELEADPSMRASAWPAASAALHEAAAEVATLLQTPVLRIATGPIEPTPSLPPGGHPLFGRIANAARMSLRIARNIGAPADADLPELAGSPARQELRALRDALSLRSTYFHHASRVVAAVVAAQLAGRLLSPEHVSWVTVATIGVLQPYSGATVKRAVERVIGTVLGGIVAVAVMFAITSPELLTLVLVPLSVASVATKPRSYRLFTLFLTPVFVLLAERWGRDWWTAAARVGDAAIGGGIALVAALVFPSREEPRLDAANARLEDAARRYASVAFEHHIAGTSSSPAVVAARREAGIALGDAESSLERMLVEPLRSKTDAEDAMLFVTHARRFAGAVTALDQEHARAEDAEHVRSIARAIDAAFDAGDGADVLARLDPPRADIERIVRQAMLLTRAR
ncbi:MAG: FUSC family protein [Labilithrix sp.]